MISGFYHRYGYEIVRFHAAEALSSPDGPRAAGPDDILLSVGNSPADPKAYVSLRKHHVPIAQIIQRCERDARAEAEKHGTLFSGTFFDKAGDEKFEFLTGDTHKTCPDCASRWDLQESVCAECGNPIP